MKTIICFRFVQDLLEIVNNQVKRFILWANLAQQFLKRLMESNRIIPNNCLVFLRPRHNAFESTLAHSVYNGQSIVPVQHNGYGMPLQSVPNTCRQARLAPPPLSMHEDAGIFFVFVCPQDRLNLSTTPNKFLSTGNGNLLAFGIKKFLMPMIPVYGAALHRAFRQHPAARSAKKQSRQMPIARRASVLVCLKNQIQSTIRYRAFQ